MSKETPATLEVTPEVKPTRKDTLILAKTTAAILELAGRETTDFVAFTREPAYEEKKKRFSRRPIKVPAGQKLTPVLAAKGWELNKQLTQDPGDGPKHALLVLEVNGALTVVNYFSSFIHDSGAIRERSIDLTNGYPELGIDGRQRSYEDPTQQEVFVQQKLADMVVRRGLHEGTMLEQTFQAVAGQHI